MTIFKLGFLFLFVISQTLSEECQKRTTENGIVCVCNADHCDTIEEVKKVNKGKFVKYTSNKEGLRFEKVEGDINSGTTEAELQITIGKETYQEILGFGGALTDSTCLNILSLDKPLQDALLEGYYSKNGIEYSIGRLPMGSTDFSLNPYTYHDQEDMTLSNFSLQPEDLEIKIPMIKRVTDINKNLDFFVSTWTAPLWMKKNNAYAGKGGFLKDNMYQVWADYFVKFLDAYTEHGVPIWGITTGNEPATGDAPVKIPSVAWTSAQMRQWVSENLGPSLRNSSHKDIKLLMLDDQRNELPWFVNEVFEDESAKNYIDGIAVHWYVDKFVPISLINDTHQLYPEKFILATEACSGYAGPPHVLLGSWERGEDYATSIIQDLNEWLVGWTDWNMALDMGGGPTYISNFVDSPVIVNAEKQEFYRQPMYYAMGHFSKFIPRRSVRISASQLDNKNVILTAVERPDGGKVVVILNKDNAATTVDIQDESAGTISLDISSHSLTSVLYWP